MDSTENIGLTSHQVQAFIDDGFIKIERAFSRDLADRCRGELWAEMGLSPDDRPVQIAIRQACGLMF
jgi:hypothetical protein